MRRFFTAAALLLGGCATLPPPPSEPATVEIPAAPPPAADGSIWRAATGVALFEDQTARRVGDVLTVVLVERTDAAKSANTSTSKDTSVDIANPTLFGRPLSLHGTPIGAFGLESGQDFDGGGDSAQSNKLEGRVSVIVTRVLPNGNLMVRGQKLIHLNQGSETVALEGIVRPLDVRADNTVTSDRVALAAIRYAGDGPVADANAMGWLARFFNSVLFPF